ncbi:MULTISPECIES: hypothetical protein [unclassified Bradyrhizobium]|uniref:hypothetical protein n=1 Tax=unclassified Bradyrhizobium TaxID=2631580 RepID=UPI002916CEFF|nr:MULTISPECIES: hypothetical protein [unclassified Bradyrhizobium]
MAAVQVLGATLSSGDRKLVDFAQATSDEEGSLFISGHGYLLTGRPSTTYDITGLGSRRPTLFLDGRQIEYQFVPLNWIPGSSIEWICRPDPVLRSFFSQHVDASKELRLVQGHLPYISIAEAALDLISRYAPEFSKLLRHSLRAILLFRHPNSNSFAALGLHGMICLNVVKSKSTLGFFIDGLVHQGGHMIFSEATLDRQLFFRLDPDSQLGEVAGQADRRSLYEILHGLYTEYAILDVMSHILQQATLAAYDELELRGRMTLTFRNMSNDVSLINAHRKKLLSADGERLVDFFESALRSFGPAYQGTCLDVSEQLDEFDWATFCRQNRCAG